MSHHLHYPATLRRNRNFIFLWCAYGISAMGDHLSEMAILKAHRIHEAGVDATSVSARMTFMMFLPFLLVGPWAGLLADRTSRKWLMITADLVRVGIMLSFGWLLASTAGWGAIGQYTPLLLIGVFAALFSPARSALLPQLVPPEQLTRANGMISGLGIIATMAAMRTGGWVAQYYEPQVAYRIDAMTFLASAALVLLISAPPVAHEPHRPRTASALWNEFRTGFAHAAVHRHVRGLCLIAALVWFCGALVNTVIPALVRDGYGGQYNEISSYRAMLGLGFVIGAVTISLLGNALNQASTIAGGLIGVSLSILLLALSAFAPIPTVWAGRIGAVSIVFAGVFGLSVIASYSALLQRTVPDRVRGRVFGVVDLCTTTALLAATGLLAVPGWSGLDAYVRYILLAVSATTFIAGVVATRRRLVRAHGQRKSLVFWRGVVHVIARLVWGMERVGPNRVPPSGPVIVASNHRSTADPLLLCCAAPSRSLAFLTAAEYHRFPVFRYFLELSDAIPVTRSGQDTAALKNAMRFLREGGSMGAFIEGGIVAPGDVSRPRDGVAMLALRTGATVIPAHISGVVYRDNVVRSLFTRHKARVRFGRPVSLADLAQDPGNRENVRKASERIFSAIVALAPKDDVYTGDTPRRRRRSQEPAGRNTETTP